MESENKFSPEKRKQRAFLQFGLPGHEHEYVFTIDSNDDVPPELASAIGQDLGPDWEVLDRASRIEIGHRKEFGLRQDDLVKGSIMKALANNYDFKLVE